MRKTRARRQMAERDPRAAVTYDTVRQIALAMPGVKDGVSYRTPALKVRGKLMARLREDGDSLAIRTDFLDRDALIQADPDAFYITDHYLDYPWVLVRLSRVRPEILRELLEQAWRRTAPRRLIEGGRRRS